MTMLRRVFLGTIGGIALPLVLLGESTLSSGAYHPLFVGAASLLMLGLLLAAELHERYLFFAACVASRMPGAPAS